MKKILLSLLLPLILLASNETGFSTHLSKNHVRSGDIITLWVHLTLNDNIKVAPPQFPHSDNFEIIDSKSSQSHQSSIRIINGKKSVSKTSTNRYIYQIEIKAEQSFTLPPLKKRVKGKEYTTLPQEITVSDSAPAVREHVSIQLLYDSTTVTEETPFPCTLRIAIDTLAGIKIDSSSYTDASREIILALHQNGTTSFPSRNVIIDTVYTENRPVQVYDFPMIFTPKSSDSISIPAFKLKYSESTPIDESPFFFNSWSEEKFAEFPGVNIEVAPRKTLNESIEDSPVIKSAGTVVTTAIIVMAMIILLVFWIGFLKAIGEKNN